MKKPLLVSPRIRRLLRWSFLAVFSITALGACANRGMKAPTGGSGGADGGQAGSGGGGGDMGSGGAGTGGDMGSGGDVDAPVDMPADMTDAADVHDANNDHACPAATFTFESNTAGARLGTMQTAAKSVTNSTANHYCGTHALEISTTFSGTSGNTIKGEVFIDLTGMQQNLTGKSITIHVAAIPEPAPTTYLQLSLITGAGSVDLKPTVKPLTSDWQTQTYSLTATDGGLMMVMSLDIQIIDTNNYNGKIYIDDIDIH